MLVTSDAKNVTNPARGADILETLKRTFEVPPYLLNIVGDYLRDRHLLYDTADSPKTKEITGAAAQGSVDGLDLWNVDYDGLLRLDMPDNTYLVSYADDVTAVITAGNAELAQLKLDQVMQMIDAWVESPGLELAFGIAEIVIQTRKCILTVIPMGVSPEVIRTQRSAKYLRVTLDNTLTFAEQIRHASSKAATFTAALRRSRANIGGLGPEKQKLRDGPVHLALLSRDMD